MTKTRTTDYQVGDKVVCLSKPEDTFCVDSLKVDKIYTVTRLDVDSHDGLGAVELAEIKNRNYYPDRFCKFYLNSVDEIMLKMGYKIKAKHKMTHSVTV